VKMPVWEEACIKRGTGTCFISTFALRYKTVPEISLKDKSTGAYFAA